MGEAPPPSRRSHRRPKVRLITEEKANEVTFHGLVKLCMDWCCSEDLFVNSCVEDHNNLNWTQVRGEREFLVHSDMKLKDFKVKVIS